MAITGTPADIQSAARACESFIAVLSSDPRVQRAYAKHWAGDKGAMARLVAEELRLDYPWLAPLLLKNLTARLVMRADVVVTPAATAEMPPGRGAKNGADHIVRYVTWYYRNVIKDPPDSKGALAREYAVGANRNNRSNSVVQNGIKRAIELLAIFEADAI